MCSKWDDFLISVRSTSLNSRLDLTSRYCWSRISNFRWSSKSCVFLFPDSIACTWLKNWVDSALKSREWWSFHSSARLLAGVSRYMLEAFLTFNCWVLLLIYILRVMRVDSILNYIHQNKFRYIFYDDCKCESFLKFSSSSSRANSISTASIYQWFTKIRNFDFQCKFNFSHMLIFR